MTQFPLIPHDLRRIHRIPSKKGGQVDNDGHGGIDYYDDHGMSDADQDTNVLEDDIRDGHVRDGTDNDGRRRHNVDERSEYDVDSQDGVRGNGMHHRDGDNDRDHNGHRGSRHGTLVLAH